MPLSPKTTTFLLDLIEHSDDTTLEHLVLVAKREAEDSLDKGDMDRHINYGHAYHLIRAEFGRRSTIDGTSCHLELPRGE